MRMTGFSCPSYDEGREPVCTCVYHRIINFECLSAYLQATSCKITNHNSSSRGQRKARQCEDPEAHQDVTNGSVLRVRNLEAVWSSYVTRSMHAAVWCNSMTA